MDENARNLTYPETEVAPGVTAHRPPAPDDPATDVADRTAARIEVTVTRAVADRHHVWYKRIVNAGELAVCACGWAGFDTQFDATEKAAQHLSFEHRRILAVIEDARSGVQTSAQT